MQLVVPPLDRTSRVTLQQQVYAALRDAILLGRLARGQRAPATRTLADQLTLSRNTIVAAYEQLHAEGYLESRRGSGSYVSRELPDLAPPARPRPQAVRTPLPPSTTGRRGRMLGALHVGRSPRSDPRAFRPGIPALDAFPVDVWSRLAGRAWRTATRGWLAYAGDAAGHPPLREAIAAYLRESRAVVCRPDQVIVVSGAQQALSLAAQVLLDPGEAIWVEDPGYLGARMAFAAAGLRMAPVPLDQEGLSIAAGERLAPGARAAYVTPSHQYPSGVTMTLTRRLELLQWARRRQAWILEDDYDSEYRYDGRPLASLQGLDTDGRVLYIGTFSKVLCPALRLGYIVVPPPLVDAFVRARAVTDRHSPTVDQVVLARFMTEGHFARHIRRTRQIYRERQEIFVRAARRVLGGALEVAPHPAGLHLVGWLDCRSDDRAVAARAAERGLDLSPLSNYWMGTPERPGLVLGYASSDQAAIRAGVRVLGELLRKSEVGSRTAGSERL